MDEQNSKSTDMTTSTTTSSSHPASRERIVENFILVWMDAHVDQSTSDCQNTLTQLRAVINHVRIFNQLNECIEFLKKIQNEKVYIITSGSLGQEFIPQIHRLIQIDVICIFCGNKSLHEEWTKKWKKIKSVDTHIGPICEVLRLAVEQCSEDSIPISLISNENYLNRNFDALDPLYMSHQIFKEILPELKYDEQRLQELTKDLTDYCREFFVNNEEELQIIDEFKQKYELGKSVWWFTRKCFIYHMMNRALQQIEYDLIIKMSFFIHDLHKQIVEEHQNQIKKEFKKPFKVYRGQGLLLKTDFEKQYFEKLKGSLMSFSNFLFTTRNKKVSIERARQAALERPDTVGILFKMNIDPSLSTAPFLRLDNKMSYIMTEDDILFSIHTVFRVDDVIQKDKNDPFYKVTLTLIPDNDDKFLSFTKHIQSKVTGERGWQRMGRLLVKLNQLNKAEELYNMLHEQTSDKNEKAVYFNNLGCIKDQQRDYEQALSFYKKSLHIRERQDNSPTTHSSLTTSYKNIAGVYYKMKEYSKSLSSYEKALEILEKNLSQNDPELASLHSDIAAVYYSMEEYSNALSHFQNAMKIYQSSFPDNHADIQRMKQCIETIQRQM